MDRRAMALLALAHTADDINQSFVPTILPLLILKLHMSYALAGSLVLAQGMSSSVIQPAIGHLADRRALPWLIGVGLLLAGGGVGFMGVMPTYPLIFLASLVSGIGIAMFHPEAGRFANYVAGAKKASGMRWFAAGGNVGFAIGPVFATAAVAAWGLGGTLAAVIPVTVLAVAALIEIPRLKTFLPPARKAGTLPSHADDWSSFWRLTVFVIVRSIAYLGLVTFIPLYTIHELHISAPLAAALLSTMLFFGIAGTLAGGPLADRFSRRAVLFWSTALAAVLVAAFVALTHAGLMSLPLAFVSAAAIGFVLVASQTSFVVLGQEYLPNRLGVATGVTMGLAVSLGGMFSPVLGRVADLWGLPACIITIASLCLFASLSTLTLPLHPRRLPYVSPATPSPASAS
jgi:FSR family fosmidomycin resistance protein-like MFS transporter